MTNVKEIVTAYLKEHGYDGLYLPDDCACEVGDLMPCSQDSGHCKPGYKGPCDCEDEHDFHINGEKHEPS